MRITTSLRLIAICSILSAAGCGQATAPGGPLTGQWVGATQHSLLGAGTLTFDLTQQGDRVTGTYRFEFPSAQPETGSVGGLVTDGRLTARLEPSRLVECVRDLTATVQPNLLSGQYVNNAHCGSGPTGTVTAQR